MAYSGGSDGGAESERRNGAAPCRCRRFDENGELRPNRLRRPGAGAAGFNFSMAGACIGKGKALHGRGEGGLICAAAAQGWRWMGMYVGMSVQKVELARPWLKRKRFWILAEVRADGSWAVGQNDTCSAPLIISRTRSYMDSSSSNLYKCKTAPRLLALFFKAHNQT